MVIEFSNLDNSRGSAPVGKIVFAFTAFIFILIPITLIGIGYYSSDKPTGSLLSPSPQTVISEDVTPPPTTEVNLPIIAADNTSTPSAIDTVQESNSTDHTATISAGLTEIMIEDKQIDSNSQILIIPQQGDSSIYFVKSKGNGFFILSTDTASTENRTVDYQVVGL